MDKGKLVEKILGKVSDRVEFLNDQGHTENALSIMDEFAEWITGDSSEVIFVSHGKIIRKD